MLSLKQKYFSCVLTSPRKMRRSPPWVIFTRSRHVFLLNCGNNSRLPLLLYPQRLRKDHRASAYVYCRYYETPPNISRDHWLLALIIAKLIKFAAQVMRPDGREKAAAALLIHFTAGGQKIICVGFFTDRVQICTA